MLESKQHAGLLSSGSSRIPLLGQTSPLKISQMHAGVRGFSAKWSKSLHKRIISLDLGAGSIPEPLDTVIPHPAPKMVCIIMEGLTHQQ
mmetsp:Transcript_10551/g.28873  ORF Transcript_10551/g.28873 Transcript_10551/m.28873 type:complete len:89 (+) Transcript_10551:925-1191(+)